MLMVTKTAQVICPKCKKPCIDIYRYRNGDKMFIHKYTSDRVYKNTEGCCVEKSGVAGKNKG